MSTIVVSKRFPRLFAVQKKRFNGLGFYCSIICASSRVSFMMLGFLLRSLHVEQFCLLFESIFFGFFEEKIPVIYSAAVCEFLLEETVPLPTCVY